MKKIALALVFLYMSPAINAQQRSSKIKFHSINQVGLLQGENTGAVSLLTTNGFRYKHVFAGVGTGIDYYSFKSVPVFGDVRVYFGHTRNEFFLYADAGTNFGWGKQTSDYFAPENYKAGFYGTTGLGYSAGLKNGMAIAVSAAYSYKKIRYDTESPNCGFVGPCYFQKQYFDYDLNRVLLQLAWVF